MAAGRIDQAITRIEAALTRLESARERPDQRTGPDMAAGRETNDPARVIALVDRHEKLREEVADTLRDLDTLIADLEQ
jgi:hypothetical protein